MKRVNTLLHQNSILHEQRIEGHQLDPDTKDEYPTNKAIRNGKTKQDQGRVHNTNPT